MTGAKVSRQEPLGAASTQPCKVFRGGANGQFLSCLKPLFQSEGLKCEVVDMKRIFYFHANKTHFHKKGFALSLVFKGEFSLLNLHFSHLHFNAGNCFKDIAKL